MGYYKKALYFVAPETTKVKEKNYYASNYNFKSGRREERLVCN